MVVVLGEGDHITLACDLQTATAGDLLRQVQSRQLSNKYIKSISDLKILRQNLLLTLEYLDMGALKLCK